MSNLFGQLTNEINAVNDELIRVSMFLEKLVGKERSATEEEEFSYFKQRKNELVGEKDLLQLQRANLDRQIGEFSI